MRKSAGALAYVFLLLGHGSSTAQGFPPWVDDEFGRSRFGQQWLSPEDDYSDRRRSYQRVQPRERKAVTPQSAPSAKAGDIRDGGARPQIEAKAPGIVSFTHDFPVNSIVIETSGRKLYYVLPNSRAYEYAISVGREGFNWTGVEKVSRKQAWPDWYPPAEMRQRDPSLPEKMTGGLKNPLGAMALYLGNTLYRIHGTNDANSLGRAASSGCFRMLNAHVLHLSSIAEVGTTVNVVASLPRGQEISQLPERDKVTPERPARPARTLRTAPPPDDGALRDFWFRER